MSKHHAAIIAIGSEIISGQITNRNAAFLSEKMFAYGIHTTCHLAVDDQIDEILKAIRYAEADSDLIFFTGGLGPTSDDITRQAIAAYLGEDLVYHQPSWDKITEFFHSLGREPAESNRQQCYFPQSTHVLRNEAGTADAFFAKKWNKQLFVLPGPPRELSRIWDDHIANMLDTGTPWILRKWRTIGKGESDLAQVVTDVLAQTNNENKVNIAYRAHAPYVEIKLKYPHEEDSAYRELCQQMKSALLPWLFEEDEESHAEVLGEYLTRFDNSIIDDTATRGYLAEYLGPHLRGLDPFASSLLTSQELTTEPDVYLHESLRLADNSHMALGVAGFGPDREFAIGMKTDNGIKVDLLPSPYPGRHMGDRNQKAIAALAVKYWVKWLRENDDLPTALS